MAITTRSKAKILVVDDLRDAADSLAAGLRFYEFEVAVAYGGTEALSVAQEFGPDLVILDIRMPGMSGLQAAREFRVLRRGVLLVAMSADPISFRALEALAAGFDVYLQKPTDLEEVVSRIRDLLRTAGTFQTDI